MKFRHSLISLIILIASGCSNHSVPSTWTTSSCRHDESSFRCVEYIRNYDSDTVTVRIPEIHEFFGDTINVRLADIDTAELRTEDHCEKEMATIAKDFVKETLESADSIHLTNIARDKYFRVVADMIVDGTSLSGILLQEGFAVPYDGGARGETDWCSKQAEL